MSVPKYRLDAIETIGRKILQEYDPALLDGPPQAVPIETIIETKFDLTLEYHCLRKNGSILGETIFDEGAAILYDQDEKRYRLIAVKAGTILVEERLCVDRLLGRLRFTCAHELGHWVLHQKLYSGTGDVAAYEGKTSLDESHGLVEWQADALAIQGWAMDSDRLKNGGSVLTKEYFDHLLEQIREIRMSERKFYQKITDIYATALDYDKSAKTTRLFFSEVQNKLHWAIHRHTAAELIVERANAEKPHMGLTSWEQYPNGKIQKYDVSIAKNYLSREELQALERIVTMYLDYAEYQAGRHIPMTMQDWSQRLNRFLEFNEHEILHDTGRVTHEIAKAFAESEFEKYRIVQDRMFESDFDHFLALEEQAARKND